MADNLAPTIAELAALPDEDTPWRSIRGWMAQCAIDDEAWVEAFNNSSASKNALENNITASYPMTLPGEFGTSESATWVERTKRDHGLFMMKDPTVPAAREQLRDQQAHLRNFFTHPALMSILGATAVGAGVSLWSWNLYAWLPTTVVCFLVMWILARMVFNEILTFNLVAQIDWWTVLVTIPCVAVFPPLGLIPMRYGLRSRRWTKQLTATAKKPRIIQDKLYFEVNEVDASITRELRGNALLCDLKPKPVDDVTRCAAIIEWDLWGFAIGAHSVMQAAWFGPASVESAACIIARAAGYGRETLAMPGPTATPGNFPGLERRCLLWNTWLQQHLGEDAVDSVKEMILADLAGGDSDRVSVVARYFAQSRAGAS